jgi:tetratricopeptide (TPR) repeat protein
LFLSYKDIHKKIFTDTYHPNVANTIYSIAQEYSNLGQYQKALQKLQEVLRNQIKLFINTVEGVLKSPHIKRLNPLTFNFYLQLSSYLQENLQLHRTSLYCYNIVQHGSTVQQPGSVQ